MSASNSGAITDTITMGKGITMTFLRDSNFLSRVHVAADAEQLYVPPHWHANHDETFRVLQGKMMYLVGKDTRIYTPDDGEVTVPRGVVHSLSSVVGIETVFEEKSTPMDDVKELFFRNLYASGQFPSNPLRLFPIIYHGDSMPSLPGGFRSIEKGLIRILGGFVSPLFGYRRELNSLKDVQ
ncbi:hypothetical protein BV22DRAFT_1190930 [Leucogyrophana mollusca]|uniref:Uncharacterized protein n=1 Tax=Leucogyrophana mollusca TaxID=85980 RepID=A0ACB8BZ89_9AGAM|nr:hypothetical protein BV22DRAFT_1190930 [Leucogyrophana mollusca]